MSFALLSSVAFASAELALASSAFSPAASAAMVQTIDEEAALIDETAAPSLEDVIVNQPVEVTNVEEAPLVFADLSDEAVVEKVRDYIQSIKTLEADFTQVAPSGGLSTGKLYLRRPGQLRFEYTPPAPLLIVATQGNVYVEDKELETTDFYPIKKDAASLSAKQAR